MIFIKECLDERQMRALEEYQRASQEKKFAELQSKFERTWKEQEEEVIHALFWCNIFTFVPCVLFFFSRWFRAICSSYPLVFLRLKRSTQQIPELAGYNEWR